MDIVINHDDAKRFLKEEYTVSYTSHLDKLPDGLRDFIIGGADIRNYVGKCLCYDSELRIKNFITKQLGDDWNNSIISKYFSTIVLLSRVSDNKTFYPKHWDLEEGKKITLIDVVEFKDKIY